MSLYRGYRLGDLLPGGDGFIVPTMLTYARVDVLPKTSSGKVQKRLQREDLRELAGKNPDKK
jgi:acyl-CoA synthetase (AMP-forming)/AMP-acid ligase II